MQEYCVPENDLLQELAKENEEEFDLEAYLKFRAQIELEEQQQEDEDEEDDDDDEMMMWHPLVII